MAEKEFEIKNTRPSSKMFRPGVMLLAGIAILLIIVVFLYSGGHDPYSESLVNAGHAGEKGSNTVRSSELPRDESLGGLLSDSIDEASCRSRYEAASYWKSSYRKPSPYLLEKLRNYEALHKKCGPKTKMYKKSIEQLKTGSSNGPLECNYLVWSPLDGLGNVMISIVSSFLYALLNDKVLLLHLPQDLQGLFCEPFPGTSWQLPDDFPADYLDHNFDAGRFGSLVEKKVLTENLAPATNASLPAHASVHISYDSNAFDMLFFSEEAHLILRKFPWVRIRSNNYFVPGLFLVPANDDELNEMFPEKETIFHHLSRYLLHPTNNVWGYITRYHDTYLANAKKRVGIQVRTMSQHPISFEEMMERILDCTKKENILPEVNLEVPLVRGKTRGVSKAVLVTHLNSGYYDRLRSMYYEHATMTGELVGVFQPSHEEQQKFSVQNHQVKALAEMYLLSFSDVIVTSPWSTFGYVAHGLGGLRPWILMGQGQSPSCVKAMSMEPCFFNPPSTDWKGNWFDMGKRLSHVRHCEDRVEGFKLLD